MSMVRVVRPNDEKKTIYGAGDEYAFLADGERVEAGPGTFLHIPIGVDFVE